MYNRSTGSAALAAKNKHFQEYPTLKITLIELNM